LTRLRKRISYWTITIVGTLVVLEALFQLLAAVSPRVDALLSKDHVLAPHAVPDELLGHRPNPDYPDHDSNGFRNPAVPDSVDIVCLGDSQTYGTGVAAEEAWPRRLELLCGCSTYSMAFGGYGPTHGMVLFPEAAELKPRIIVQAFYSGNDLYDSFYMVYVRHRLEKYRSDEASVLRAVDEAESRESIDSRVSKLYRMGKPGGHGRPRSLRAFLSDYSKFYGLLRASKDAVISMARAGTLGKSVAWWEAKSFAESNARYCLVFDGNMARTVFTPEYRLCAVDLSDPRISEGLRISLDVIRDMNDLAKSMNIKFVCLLIPTKEFVFGDLVLEDKNMVNDMFREVIDNETLLWNRAKVFFDENGIDYIDSTPMLKKALESGDQPYQMSTEDHPNVFGQEAIARAVYSGLWDEASDR
jgi:hypothetical protein